MKNFLLLLLLLLIPNLVMGGFDGVDGKRVLDYLDSVTENITGEVVDNPELILAQSIKKEDTTQPPPAQDEDFYKNKEKLAEQWLDNNPDLEGTDDYIKMQKAFDELKEYNKSLMEERNNEILYRRRCAYDAGEAKTEYAAKRIEATCLKAYGLK